MSNNVILEGMFVTLRSITVNDAEITFKWRQSDRASLLNQGAGDVEQQKNWISSRPSSEYNFIIELKSGAPLGMLSLVDIDNFSKHAETARFLIGEEDAAKGVPAAVESMKLLYDFAFGALELRRLYGTISAENHLMIKWQKYLGMVEEGRLRKHYYINGKFHDAVYLGILKEEYLSITLPKMKSLISLALVKPVSNTQNKL